jgi:hypothetical protein
MQKLAEVIESNSRWFVAQTYRLHDPPPLGSLVMTHDGDTDVYAVVASARTSGLEPGRRPIARGEFEQSDEGIFASNPQLSKLLATTFTAFIVGYRRGEEIKQYLPSRPSRVHSFVLLVPDVETRSFATTVDFIDLLLAAEGDIAVDEVIAASLRCLAAVQSDSALFLLTAGKHLAARMGDDIQRLNSILKRLS